VLEVPQELRDLRSPSQVTTVPPEMHEGR
jgi:hypothetical protein